MSASMSPEVFFYAVAIPAVLLTGLSKGGFGAGIGALGTPLIALAVSPVTAAAILLPVLLLMDAVGLYSYRGNFQRTIIVQMLPGALAGTALGWATAALVPDAAIKILVGAIAIAFALNQALGDWLQRLPAEENRAKAAFWGCLAGYASFVAHAGGPPFQAYTLPLKIDKLAYAGTTVVFFAILNAVKVLPYLALGQFTNTNLVASATLAPFAIAGVICGVWLVNKVAQTAFYAITYAAMLLIGAKLVWDGAASFL